MDKTADDPFLAAIHDAESVMKADLERGLKMLQSVVPTTPSQQVRSSRLTLFYSERANRVRKGLQPFHAASFADLGFPNSPHEYLIYRNLLAANPKAAMESVCLYFLEGGTDRSVYSAFKNHVMGTVDFAMPAVSGGVNGKPADHAIWLACDKRYLAFANPFIRSIKSHGFHDVVLHVLEDNPAGKVLYHAERFIHLADWMDKNDRPVWLMDVDAIANRDPAELFPLLNGADVAFRARPGRFEPWNQINASVVGFNNTAAGKAYLKTVAAFIKRTVDSGSLQWGIDQVALLCCLRSCPVVARLLDQNAVDYDYVKTGVIWCDSGTSKWTHLDLNAKDSERQPYLDAFHRWMK